MTKNRAARNKEPAKVTPQRSAIMRSVKGQDTKPEKLVRSALHKQGFRFRLHNPDLPGKPDIVLPKYKAVIRVMGCFWHGHSCQRGNRIPKTNVDYWINKIQRNVERDKIQKQALRKQGWKIIDLWECDLKTDAWLSKLVKKIQS